MANNHASPYWSDTTTSASDQMTRLYLNIYEVGRGDNSATFRVDWQATLHPESYSYSGVRDLIIYRWDGLALASSRIKQSGQRWERGSTYAGSFTFAAAVGNAGGSWGMRGMTAQSGSCCWSDPNKCYLMEVGFSAYQTDVSAPTGMWIDPPLFENKATLRWHAGVSGINNALVDYHAYYRVNGGAEIGVSSQTLAEYTIDTSSWPRGSTLDFHVASIAQNGNNIFSGWSARASKNRAPNAPTSPKLLQTNCVPGDPVTITFANTGDPDGNLVGFEACSDDGIVRATIADAAAISLTIPTGWATQGTQTAFRVRAYDSLGVRGTWSTATPQKVLFNQAPGSPVIAYPVEGSTLYSSVPRILLQAGQTNDGPLHYLELQRSYDGGISNTRNTGAGDFSRGADTSLSANQKIVAKPNSMGAWRLGAVSVFARMQDGYVPSEGTVQTAFTIGTVAFTDSTLVPGETPIKARHITELHTPINNLRKAYGLAAATFSGIAAGQTPISNAQVVTELQEALQGVVNAINNWDAGNSTHDIAVTWVDIREGGGVSAQRLRLAIEQLRGLITSI